MLTFVQKPIQLLVVALLMVIAFGCDTDEPPITPSEDDAVSATAIGKGEALTMSELSGRFVDPETEESIPGTLQWDEPDLTLDEDTTVSWTFIPDDDAYETVTGTVTVVVTIDKVEPVLDDEIEVTAIEEGANLSESSLSGTFVDADTGDVISGTLEWKNPEKIIEEATEVMWQFIPDDDKYEVVTGTILVTVKTVTEGFLETDSIFYNEIMYKTYERKDDEATFEDFESELLNQGYEVYEPDPGYESVFVEETRASIGGRFYADDTHYLYAYQDDSVDGIIMTATIEKQVVEKWLYPEDAPDEDYVDVDDFETLPRYEGSFMNRARLRDDGNTGHRIFPQLDETHPWAGDRLRYRLDAEKATLEDVYDYYKDTLSTVTTNGESLVIVEDIYCSDTNRFRLVAEKSDLTVAIKAHFDDTHDEIRYTLYKNHWTNHREDLPDGEDFGALPVVDLYDGALGIYENTSTHYVPFFAARYGNWDEVEYIERVYVVEAEADEVFHYYLNNLKNYDGDWHEEAFWPRTYTRTHFVWPNTRTLQFNTKDQFITIVVSDASEYKDAVTLSFYIQDLVPLPDEDLTGEDFEHVERYPGSIIYEEAFEELAIYSALIYAVPMETSTCIMEVFDYYLDYFNEDWEIIEEDVWVQGGHLHFLLHFRRDEQNVKFEATGQSPYQDSFTLVIHDYYEGEGDLPQEDVMGEDFEDIERYPDSVLLLAEDNLRLYGSYDSLEDVEQFYMTYLPEEGFTIVDTDSDEDSVTITAMKGFDTVIYIMISEDSDYDDAVEITIGFTD